MIEILITTLVEMISANKEHTLGQADEEFVADSKKRFLQALDQYIDYRIELRMEDRRRKMSQERISVADSLNSAMKSTAVSVKSLSALNSAPPPPVNPGDHEKMEAWIKEYNEWYDTRRKNGLTFG